MFLVLTYPEILGVLPESRMNGKIPKRTIWGGKGKGK